VNQGATLTFGSGVDVVLESDVMITDNGTLNIINDHLVRSARPYFDWARGITVNGTLSVTGTSLGRNESQGHPALVVNPGGHLIAHNSRFGWASMTLANGSVLQSGDLTITPSTLPSPSRPPPFPCSPTTCASATSTCWRAVSRADKP